MAQTIKTADLVIVDGTNYVDCRVRMPASEYATFIATGTLTDAVPTAVTTWIATRVTAGATTGA